jgi:L-threonylcarbamoyladenylate synthase
VITTDTQIIDLTKELEAGLIAACGIIKAGGVVAFPTETVYGLGADAMNEAAVKKIFEAKGRPSDNPLIVHIAKMDKARALCEMTSEAEKLLQAFWPGPFTAVLKKKDSVPDCVTAGLDTVAVRMPGHDYALAFLGRCGCPIAAPSANTSTGVSPTKAAHVYRDLKGKIPLILDGGSARVGVESTVCDLTGQAPVILRPGGITLEMLRSVDPLSAVYRGKKEYKPTEAPPSPGMKYRHYAPKAEVFIVRAKDREQFIQILGPLINEDLKFGRKAVIMCTIEDAQEFEGAKTVALGSKNAPEEIAQNLFDALRSADAAGADHIYFEALNEEGMGLAVMNRIQKAAQFREIFLGGN